MSQVFWKALYMDHLILSQQHFEVGIINTSLFDDKNSYFLSSFNVLFSVYSIFTYIFVFLTSV